MMPFDLDDEELEATRKLYNVSWVKQEIPLNEEGYYEHICSICNKHFWYKAKHWYICPECEEKEKLNGRTISNEN